MFPMHHGRGMHAPAGLHLHVTIVDWNKRSRVKEVMRRQRGPAYLCRAQGTAGSHLMDLLGLGSVDKAVVWGFAPQHHIPSMQAERGFPADLNKAGTGISFSIPLSGVLLPFRGGGNNLHEVQRHFENEVEQMSQSIEHDLIVAVVEEGACEEVMAAARSAGARGGTTFHALRFGMEDAARFFGIPMQDKKDIVAILTGREEKLPIMQAIQALPEAGGHTLLFALPAANVLGFGGEKE